MSKRAFCGGGGTPNLQPLSHHRKRPSGAELSCPCQVLTYVVVKVKVAQSCLTLCNPTDYTVHGILQVRTLEWVAFPFSRGSSQPRDQTQVSHIASRFFTSWATREALICIRFMSKTNVVLGTKGCDGNNGGLEGTCPVTHWVGLRASSAEGAGPIPCWGTKTHIPQGQKVNK